jgi:hypothetical protein
MRKSGWMLAVVVAVAVLAGCRSTACRDLAKAYADMERKTQPCMEHAPLPALDPSRCEQNLDKCAWDDLDQLEAQVECYQALGTCKPEQKAAYLEAISACDNHVLSNTCEAAIY